MGSRGKKKRRQHGRHGGNGQQKNRRHGVGYSPAAESAKIKRLLAGKTHYVISMGDAGGAMGIPVVPGAGGHRALAVFSAKAKARAFYSAFIDTPAAYLDMLEDCAAAGVALLTELAAGEYGLLPVNLGGVGLLAAAIDADGLLIDPDADGRALPIGIKGDPLG